MSTNSTRKATKKRLVNNIHLLDLVGQYNYGIIQNYQDGEPEICKLLEEVNLMLLELMEALGNLEQNL